MSAAEPTKPFTTDGCSGGMTYLWNRVSHRDPPWNDCCVEHDRAYWRGGSKRERLEADIALMRCVAGQGHFVIALLMFLAVRIGGSPYWPLPWRWAYGHAYVNGGYREEVRNTQQQ